MSAATFVPMTPTPIPLAVYGPNYVVRMEVPEIKLGGSAAWRLVI